MKSLLKNSFAKLGYRLQGTKYCPRQLLEPANLRVIEFDDVVCRQMFELGQNLSFIQVGAYDGKTRDPLRKYIDRCGWTGVLVEPQPMAATLLRNLYSNNNKIIVVEAALDGESRSRKIFTVDSQIGPDWAGGLASFQRETIVKHSGLISGLQTMIKENIVECITFEKVFDLLSDQRLDLLQIDTEGADCYIVSLFPFDRLTPAIVHWEVKHLTKGDREDCLERLAHYGYRFASSGDEDMIAVLDVHESREVR